MIGNGNLERAMEGLHKLPCIFATRQYKANTDWKTLGSEWRQYEEIFPKSKKSNVDIVSLECHGSVKSV
jgi:5-methyltetrahydropteroyltriglutamate--homocysteine methyltransferase